MSFHAQLCAEVARQLAPKVRPKYLALTTERVVLTTPEDGVVSAVYPDVGLVSAATPQASSATVLAEPPLRMLTEMPEGVPHLSIEIRDAAQRRLVTAIEVLSPTNKQGDGRDEYLARRGKLLLSTAHLVEIDLLRRGQRVPMREPLPAADYFVFLSRSGNRPISDVWPIGLPQELPTIPVPLLTGDPDVELDLQLALTTVYDALGYDLALDYTHAPAVPLSAEHARWAAELIGSKS